MNPPTTPPIKAASADQDMAKQARPGHGIPSQDPSTAAQVAIAPLEAEREAKSVLTGGGMVAGAASGAAIGVLVGGPVGVVVGATLGAVAGAAAGALGGAVVGSPGTGAAARPP
jgi:non-heme chloroperoxidase